MRTLVVGTLAVTLVGCSCLLPPQENADLCMDSSGFGCLNRTAASRPAEPTPAPSRTSSATTRAKSAVAAKAEEPSTARVRDKPQLAAQQAKPAVIEAKVETPVSVRPADDPIITKAKSTIAAKLEEPTSAEFVEMNRAIRKNTLGKSVDTICGRIKGKKASGEDTGDRPFLYLVKEDDAYVVDGPANSASASAYRNICSS